MPKISSGSHYLSPLTARIPNVSFSHKLLINQSKCDIWVPRPFLFCLYFSIYLVGFHPFTSGGELKSGCLLSQYSFIWDVEIGGWAYSCEDLCFLKCWRCCFLFFWGIYWFWFIVILYHLPAGLHILLLDQPLDLLDSFSRILFPPRGSVYVVWVSIFFLSFFVASRFVRASKWLLSALDVLSCLCFVCWGILFRCFMCLPFTGMKGLISIWLEDLRGCLG